ncbi:piggyBac transposable element-derived protein 4-like isoform X2 [Penaeus japonicus]|uniref:piggyBac transposable element-derived protein 4-like isoform X2 n=1 Tax=Penaeus japonicus TaxID=27405 RepID=UPI001C712264|nr:piggyBac transposable element-derived protein 4-like isoform X2 [Penaeus japonicus]
MDSGAGPSTREAFFDFSDDEGYEIIDNDHNFRQNQESESSPSQSSDDEDYDFVSTHNTSLDSDEPLSEYANRVIHRNSPGTPGFKWRNRENVTRKFGFAATPGLTVDLSASQSPHKFLQAFFTDEMINIIVEETNSTPNVTLLW